MLEINMLGLDAYQKESYSPVVGVETRVYFFTSRLLNEQVLVFFVFGRMDKNKFRRKWGCSKHFVNNNYLGYDVLKT